MKQEEMLALTITNQFNIIMELIVNAAKTGKTEINIKKDDLFPQESVVDKLWDLGYKVVNTGYHEHIDNQEAEEYNIRWDDLPL